MNRYVAILLVCAFAWMSGCSGNGLQDIKGQVTVNGVPVKDGSISFLPPDGKGPTARAIIIEGQYSCKVSPGTKRMEINGFKVVGRRRADPRDMSTPIIDVKEEIVPARYNTATTLTCDVKSGKYTYDFELQSP